MPELERLEQENVSSFLERLEEFIKSGEDKKIELIIPAINWRRMRDEETNSNIVFMRELIDFLYIAKDINTDEVVKDWIGEFIRRLNIIDEEYIPNESN